MKEYNAFQDYTAVLESMGVTYSFPKLTKDHKICFPVEAPFYMSNPKIGTEFVLFGTQLCGG